MVYRGRVKKDTVLPNNGDVPPESAEAILRPVSSRSKPAKISRKPKNVRKGLRKFEGVIDDLPADASQKVDEYLYGHNKR